MNFLNWKFNFFANLILQAIKFKCQYFAAHVAFREIYRLEKNSHESARNEIKPKLHRHLYQTSRTSNGAQDFFQGLGTLQISRTKVLKISSGPYFLLEIVNRSLVPSPCQLEKVRGQIR